MSRQDDPKTERGEARQDDASHAHDPRKGDKSNPDNRQDEMGKRLDEGLEETFPSSDPVSVKITK